VQKVKQILKPKLKTNTGFLPGQLFKPTKS